MPEPLRLTIATSRAVALVALLVLSACLAGPSPSAAPVTSSPSLPNVTPTPPNPSSPRQPRETPSATPVPPLSLELPAERDPRVVDVAVTPAVAADGDGTLTVSVTSMADTRVDEVVIRWPTGLDATLFLAPFEPDAARIAEGGPPLIQAWSKWVVGPGERGEPAGTTSLGWGPLDPGATLQIPIVVTRRGPGPVAFDLQVLAGNAILAADDGDPAETRVEIP